MPNIFKNREQKRKFNKLPNDKKKDLVAETIAKEVSGVLNKHISLSFLSGIKYEKKIIYETFIKEIDELPVGSEERNNKIEDFLSVMRIEYLSIVQEENKKNSSEEKEEK